MMKKILKYELKQLFRDKKTVFFVFILPLVIFPLINGVLSKAISSKIEGIAEERTEIVSERNEFLESVLEQFKDDSVVFITYTDDVSRKDSLLERYAGIITSEFNDSLKVNTLIITYSAKNDKASIQTGNFIRKLKKSRKITVEERFNEIGIENYFEESVPQIINTTGKREMQNAENANLLPITIIMILLLGTFMISNYIILGEKDNNTLESLLSSGIKREHIIYGKMSVVVLAGVTMSVLELISFFLYGKFTGAMNFNISLNRMQILSFIPVVISVSILISSISVFISCKLKSSTAGQLVFLPLMITFIVLTLFGTFEGVSIKRGLLLLPIINSAGIIKAVIKDQFMFFESLIVVFSNLIYAVVIMKSSSDYLNGEDILNKNSEMDFIRKGLSKGVIFTIYALLVVSYMLVGGYLQTKNIVSGLVYSQILILGGFAVIMQKFTGIKYRDLFRLRKFRTRYMVFAVILGITARYPISLISEKLLYVFPMPKIMNEMNILTSELGQINIVFMIFIIAILPAIFEEAVFRGIFLTVTEKKYKLLGASIVTGLMFGGMHLNVFTMFETSILGIILGILTIFSGSIFPAMVLHFTNNATSVILMKLLNEGVISEDNWLMSNEYIAYIMGVIAAVTFFFMTFRKKKI